MRRGRCWLDGGCRDATARTESLSHCRPTPRRRPMRRVLSTRTRICRTSCVPVLAGSGEIRSSDSLTLSPATTSLHTFQPARAGRDRSAHEVVRRQAAIRLVAASVGLHVSAVHWIRHQSPHHSGAYLVAGRSRRSTHADLDDPGRRPAEDGRLRHHSHLLSDLPGWWIRAGLAWSAAGRGEHGLWSLRRHGPDRLQAAGRLQLGQPHGLRRARPRRLVGSRLRPV